MTEMHDLAVIQRQIIDRFFTDHTTDSPWAGKIEELTSFTGAVADRVKNLSAAGKNGRIPTLGKDRGNGEGSRREECRRSRERATQFVGSVGSLTTSERYVPERISLKGLMEGLGSRVPAESGVEWRADLTELETVFLGDGLLMSQAVENVAANGVEAMSRGGVLVLETAVEPFNRECARLYGLGDSLLCATVSIRDEGDGVADDIRERVFDPFFTTKEGNMGLGLAIAQEIVRFHGGVMTLCSEPRRGCTVSIILPVYESRSRGAGPKAW